MTMQNGHETLVVNCLIFPLTLTVVSRKAMIPTMSMVQRHFSLHLARQCGGMQACRRRDEKDDGMRLGWSRTRTSLLPMLADFPRFNDLR